MKTLLLLRSFIAVGMLILSGCAPQALYFHESTKVGFAAAYTASDSEPVSTSFGYRRRIVAVVPGKERTSATGKASDAVNQEEALSTISKFYVKAGTRDGLVIRNNFATGMAARKLMKEPFPAAVAVAGLMHGTPVITDATGAVVNREGEPIITRTGTTETPSDVAASRVARIRSKMVGGGGSASGDSRVDQPASKELFRKDGQTWVRETFPDGRVVERPLKKSAGDKPKPEDGAKTKDEPKRPDDGQVAPDLPPLPQDGVNQTPKAELFRDPVTGKTMKRIKKADGSTEVVPLKP
jgi:hypothetical protein